MCETPSEPVWLPLSAGCPPGRARRYRASRALIRLHLPDPLSDAGPGVTGPWDIGGFAGQQVTGDEAGASTRVAGIQRSKSGNPMPRHTETLNSKRAEDQTAFPGTIARANPRPILSFSKAGALDVNPPALPPDRVNFNAHSAYRLSSEF